MVNFANLLLVQLDPMIFKHKICHTWSERHFSWTFTANKTPELHYCLSLLSSFNVRHIRFWVPTLTHVAFICKIVTYSTWLIVQNILWSSVNPCRRSFTQLSSSISPSASGEALWSHVQLSAHDGLLTASSATLRWEGEWENLELSSYNEGR